MTQTTPHPSRELLSAYNLGQLPPEQSTAIESHISECEPCCDTIMSLSSDDTFVGILKYVSDKLMKIHCVFVITTT